MGVRDWTANLRWQEAAPISVVSRRTTGKIWLCRDRKPNRLRRAVLEHIAYGATMRTEETLSTYAQSARIMRRRIR